MFGAEEERKTQINPLLHLSGDDEMSCQIC